MFVEKSLKTGDFFKKSEIFWGKPLKTPLKTPFRALFPGSINPQRGRKAPVRIPRESVRGTLFGPRDPQLFDSAGQFVDGRIVGEDPFGAARHLLSR